MPSAALSLNPAEGRNSTSLFRGELMKKRCIGKKRVCVGKGLDIFVKESTNLLQNKQNNIYAFGFLFTIQ
jgi:hypothetical protein